MPQEVSDASLLPHNTRPLVTLDQFSGPLFFDEGGIRLLRGAEAIRLTIAEWRILRMLHDHAHQVVTRKQLLIVAANGRQPGTNRSLDTHVSRLRNKIETEPGGPQIIHTIHGFGYRLDPR